MEISGSSNLKLYVLGYELLGTAIILFAFNFSADTGHEDNINGLHGAKEPIAVGMTYFTNIIFLGSVCGGHFNPAVTLGLLISKGRDNFVGNLIFSCMVAISQLMGAILGVLIAFTLTVTIQE